MGRRPQHRRPPGHRLCPRHLLPPATGRPARAGPRPRAGGRPLLPRGRDDHRHREPRPPQLRPRRSPPHPPRLHLARRPRPTPPRSVPLLHSGAAHTGRCQHRPHAHRLLLQRWADSGDTGRCGSVPGGGDGDAGAAEAEHRLRAQGARPPLVHPRPLHAHQGGAAVVCTDGHGTVREEAGVVHDTVGGEWGADGGGSEAAADCGADDADVATDAHAALPAAAVARGTADAVRHSNVSSTSPLASHTSPPCPMPCLTSVLLSPLTGTMRMPR